MTTREYEGPTQEERQKQFAEDRYATYHGRAIADAALERGGRWAAVTETTIVGTTPDGSPRYPTLPATSPWSRDPCGQEPPLGYSIDEVGEALGGASPAAAPTGNLPLAPVVAAPGKAKGDTRAPSLAGQFRRRV